MSAATLVQPLILAVIYGNRDFRPRAARYRSKSLAPPNWESMLGGVETHADARKCAEVLIRHSGVPTVAVGISAGVSYGNLRFTLHSLRDLDALRAINNLTIVASADNFETREVIRRGPGAGTQYQASCNLLLQNEKPGRLIDISSYIFADKAWNVNSSFLPEKT